MLVQPARRAILVPASRHIASIDRTQQLQNAVAWEMLKLQFGANASNLAPALLEQLELCVTAPLCSVPDQAFDCTDCARILGICA